MWVCLCCTVASDNNGSATRVISGDVFPSTTHYFAFSIPRRMTVECRSRRFTGMCRRDSRRYSHFVGWGEWRTPETIKKLLMYSSMRKLVEFNIKIGFGRSSTLTKQVRQFVIDTFVGIESTFVRYTIIVTHTHMRACRDGRTWNPKTPSLRQNYLRSIKQIQSKHEPIFTQSVDFDICHRHS